MMVAANVGEIGKMEFTGERFVPGTHGMIELEHIHRYLQASRIAAGKVVLDIASGEGYGSAMLAAHATKVIGVDISAEAIEHSRTRYQRHNLEFRVGTCADIPLDDATVDLIVSFETVEHHDQHDRMMQELKRVLRPGGVLLISSPDKLHYTIEPGRLNPFHIKELHKGEFQDLISKYFVHITYFAQRVFYGSGIFASQASPPLSSYLLSKELVKEFSGLSDPTYWIALASDCLLPSLASSVLEQPIDELEVVGQLKQALSERDRRVADLTSERDRRVADLTEQLGQHNGQIITLSHEVSERNNQIATLRESLTERGRQLADLRGLRDEVAACKAQIEKQQLWTSVLRAAAFTPLALNFPNAWVGHLPFAAWLIQTLSPGIFVELGTHSGNSFFTFCQATTQSGISTRCYAVDTWQGDEHAGRYDESVFARVSAYQQQHYSKFSRLLRMTFDDALQYFSDASISLLHIDGLHTYDAVRWDFESWLPKLAPGAVVLFHDTNVRERNFGVWKLWEELAAAYPLNLQFAHSHGLGVLQLNDAPEHTRLPWLEPGSPDKQLIVDFFSSLGLRQLDRAQALELQDQVAQVTRIAAEKDAHIISRDEEIRHLHEQNQHMHEQSQHLTQLEERIAGILSSRSWRSTAPLRAMGRWMRGILAESHARQGSSNSQGRVDAKQVERIAPLFDAAWYLEKNPDVRAAGRDPLEHFAQKGWTEGRNPNPLFDCGWYLQRNTDVRNAGLNPLDHFVTNGWKEGRNPHPLFDVRWYLEANPDVLAAGINPLQHFILQGGAEGRKPHPLFDTAWYRERHLDVKASGVNPLVHFVENGWTEGRSPNLDYNLPWYLETYEDVRASGMNPFIHYVEYGIAEGRASKPEAPTLATAKYPQATTTAPRIPSEIDRDDAASFDITQYLPQLQPGPTPPTDIGVDVIVPVYRGLEETRRCLMSLLADRHRPRGLIRVVDDCSPEPELSAWLSSLAADGSIELCRNRENLGFVRSVNHGIASAGLHDVVLLNSDTEVPSGFLQRLAGHAYSKPNIASVTPFSNAAGEFAGFPDKICRQLPPSYSLAAIDKACEEANGLRSLEIPTGVGFCMYIRRACLDEVGHFDADAFGRGYGEETDFCQRALIKGWRHLLACNTFVYHVGEVSFGQNAPERAASWNLLVSRYPGLPLALRSHLASQPTVPAVFAATARLFQTSPLPTVLVMNHSFEANNASCMEDAMDQTAAAANLLEVRALDSHLELSVPSIPGHPTLRFSPASVQDLSTYLHACSVSRIHLRHWIGIGPVFHELIGRMGIPVNLTVHDYVSA
jgi:GT2 family glycosyltransferase/ubiquinone/menaquinone biosynthesis C-methylase UbiE/TolA-binding protein